MFRLIILSMMMLTVISVAYGPILKTGQTQSYDTEGNIVTDGSIKDDGYYQAGYTRDYNRSDNIVTDRVTGLQWQDDNTYDRPWLTQQNYDEGNYDDTSGDTATTFCNTLGLGGYSDWRLPDIRDMETLMDGGVDAPTVTKGVFQNIWSRIYWSSTTYVHDRSKVWAAYFNVGVDGDTDKNRRDVNVFCIRGEELKPTVLSRRNDIVSDSASGLQWQDDGGSASIGNITWLTAITYCEELSLGEHSDWRLPNRKELLSIVDYDRYDPAIDTSVFRNISADPSRRYWTSSSKHNDKTKVRVIDFTSGDVSDFPKNWFTIVLCVRGGHLDPLECPEGQHPKQGERICIPGTAVPGPGPYPDRPCETNERPAQGTDSCEAVAPVDPPGIWLPTCTDGERLTQGIEECIPMPGCTDVDDDGYFSTSGCGTLVDCNDTNPNINPSASEICNGLDDDCNGQIDEDLSYDRPNSDTQCVNGIVQMTCNPGWMSCDGNEENGCETQTTEGCPP